MSRLRESLEALCAIDSTTGREAELLPLSTRSLEALGAEVEILPVEGDRANVLARWTEANQVRLLLSSHLDTVPPYSPPRPTATGLHGRGTCDAKGQIVAQWSAIQRLVDLGHRDIAWLGVVGEEVDGRGAEAAKALAPRLPRLGAVINGEPTDNRLPSGQKGFLSLELIAHGQRAHGGDASAADPLVGTNALWRLHHWLDALRGFDLADDPDFGPEIWNLGRIHGGEAANVVAGEARAEIVVRTVPGSTFLEQCRRRLPTHGELVVHADEPPQRFARPAGWPASRSTPAVGFGSDAGRLAGLLPANAADQVYLLGPGSIAHAHTDDEHLDWADLEDGVETIFDLCRRLLDAEGGTR